MKMDRRDLLKTLGSTTVAATLAGILPEVALAQAAAAAGGQERQRAPERILQSEPVLSLNAAGEATLEWETVVPTQGATIYLGIPNDEIALDWPIYSSIQAVHESSAATQHKATFDVRAYASRFAARLLFSGGELAYRLEMLDPRKPATRFIDRHFHFQVENDKFRLGLNLVEGPFLTLIDKESATVWWVTDQPSSGEVRLADDRVIPSDAKSAHRHVVRVTGLQAGQSYAYQVVSRTADSEIRSRSGRLRTAPSEPEFSFVFTCDGRTGGLGGGDTALEGINGTSARALAAQMARHEPHFFIFTGDLISGYTTREDDFRAQLRSWKRLYGPLWRQVPIYTGMGNHESLLDVFDDGTQADKHGEQSAEAVFVSEFVHPLNGPEPEKPGLPPYKGTVYSFDYAGCHFVQLNSDYWYSSHPDVQPGNPFGRLLPGQLEWFEKDLDQARQGGPRHIFVFVHEPAFPNGGHVTDSLWGGGQPDGVAARDRFWAAANRAGVTAVFSGHEHNYSRTLIDGETPVHNGGATHPAFTKPTWQVVQGAAGAPFYPRDFSVPWRDAVKKFVAHTWSYCHIQVRGSQVHLDTYSYTGQLLDQAQLA
ncbi:MAG TPA: metallophosphoesterase [Candidatus Angelobacter sp.]